MIYSSPEGRFLMPCPITGYPMRHAQEEFFRSPVKFDANYYTPGDQAITPLDIQDNHLYIATREALNKIVLPGFWEIELLKAIEEESIAVNLWPDLDRVDLRLPELKHEIDVKAWLSPTDLIEHIKKHPIQFSKTSQNFMLVPEIYAIRWKGGKDSLKKVTQGTGIETMTIDDYLTLLAGE